MIGRVRAIKVFPRPGLSSTSVDSASRFRGLRTDTTRRAVGLHFATRELLARERRIVRHLALQSVRVPHVVPVLVLEVVHLAVAELRAPHVQRLLRAQVDALEEERQLEPRLVPQVVVPVQTREVSAHAQRVRRAPATAWRGPFRMTRSARLASDPRGISKRSTEPPNAVGRRRTRDLRRENGEARGGGRVTAVLAAAAAPPAAPPSLSATFSAPFVRLGPEEKTARRRRREVLDVLRRRRGAFPASAKVRRRDASRCGADPRRGLPRRWDVSGARSQASRARPRRRACRTRPHPAPPPRRVSAVAPSPRAPPPSPGGGRRPAPRARARRGRARAPSRKTTPGSRRATRPPVARSNATHLCVPREARGRTGERRAGGAVLRASPAPRRPPRTATGRARPLAEPEPRREERRLLLHEPPGRGRRRAERQARRGDGEALRGCRRGARRVRKINPRPNDRVSGPVRPRASPRPAGEAPSVEPARGDARRRRGETRDGDETSARVRRGAGGFRARMGRAGGKRILAPKSPDLGTPGETSENERVAFGLRVP